MPVRFQLRRDTSTTWSSINPTLEPGEPGLETDTFKLKIGDGATAWNSLAYYPLTDFQNLQNLPTTLAGYGITDGYENSDVDTHLNTSTATTGEVLSWNGADYDWVAQSGGGGGIALTDLSVTSNAAGTAALTYNNTTGVFSYTPPDLSSYLTSYTETDTLDSVVGRGATTSTTAVIPFYYANQAAFPNATTYHGAMAHSHTDGAMYFAHGGVWNKLANNSQLANASNWDTAFGWGDHSTAGYLTSETTTTLTADSVNTKLVFTDETGTANDVDLSWAVDDTNLARLTSGTLDALTGIATFTRDDATTFTVDFSALLNITLADLSVTQNAASGNGTLSYNNTTGVFSYTPPDLSGYLASGAIVVPSVNGTAADGNLQLGNNSDAMSINGNTVTSQSTSTTTVSSSAGSVNLYSVGGTDARLLLNGSGGQILLQSNTQMDILAGTAGADGDINITWGNVDIQRGNLTVAGLTTLAETTEVTSDLTGATGVVAHDLSNGAVFDHTSLAADFTANFTNVPTTASRTISVALILTQGATAYMPTAVQIDGVAQTILWQGGSAPTGTASGTDVVSFTLIRSSGSAWKVIGSATGYA